MLRQVHSQLQGEGAGRGGADLLGPMRLQVLDDAPDHQRGDEAPERWHCASRSDGSGESAVDKQCAVTVVTLVLFCYFMSCFDGKRRVPDQARSARKDASLTVRACLLDCA